MTCSGCGKLREELLAVLTVLSSLGTKVSSLVEQAVCCADNFPDELTNRGKDEQIAAAVSSNLESPRRWADRVGEWVAVGGPRRSQRLRSKAPLPLERVPVLPTSNTYDVLSDVEESPEPQCESTSVSANRTRTVKRGVLVIGSSNVRRIVGPFQQLAQKGSVRSAVHSKCIPGGTVPDVIRAIPGAIRDAGCDHLQIVVHAGANDACRKGSEEILNSFRQLAKCVVATGKAESVQVDMALCSIVPRTDRGPLVWSRVEGINQRLRRLCTDEGLHFVDLRPGLDAVRFPLDRSGVHYEREAATGVARTLWRNLDLGAFLEEE